MKTAALVIFVLLAVLCIDSAISASVPPMINYQGKLTTPAGTPIADGTYSMTFAIYDVPTGGTALWSETNPSVQVKGGLFAVMLGSVTNLPANIFDTPDRFFGIKIGTDSEMIPRQQIASVGFAVKSAETDTAKSADIALAVVDGAITEQKLANGSVTAQKAPFALAGPGNGFRIQAGYGGTGTDNVADITFPTPFTQLISVVVTPYYNWAADTMCTVGDTSTTGFKAWFYMSNGVARDSQAFYWMAIGK